MLLYLTSNSEAIKGKIDNLITFKILSSIWGITSEIKSNNKKETGEIFAIYTSGKGPIFLRFYSNCLDLILFFNSVFILYWSIVGLQYYVSFRYAVK